jgi:hypothetical protein
LIAEVSALDLAQFPNVRMTVIIVCDFSDSYALKLHPQGTVVAIALLSRMNADEFWQRMLASKYVYLGVRPERTQQ